MNRLPPTRTSMPTAWRPCSPRPRHQPSLPRRRSGSMSATAMASSPSPTKPCSPSAERIEVDYNQPDAAAAAAAAAGARASEAQAGRTAEAELLDTEIYNSSQRLSTLPIERDAEIAVLRQQRFLGTEALNQDAWKADMTEKMEAVAAKYQQLIDAEQARLNDLRARRAALGAAK